MIARNLVHQNLLTRWQAAQLLAGRSSFYLGKYRLIELLGRGDTGSVFLAEHVTMNRRVVLKVISRQVSTDQASLDAFLVEARAVSGLDHPNIVHAYSIDNEADRYFLVMEYVDGVDLQHLVEGTARSTAIGPRTISGRRPTAWTMPTSRTWSTATSGRRICC